MSTRNSSGLCFRCEHRARYYETGQAIRSECGSSGAVCGCYMYIPVLPCITKPVDTANKRPRFAGIISAWEQYAGVMRPQYDTWSKPTKNDMELSGTLIDKKTAQVARYWIPSTGKMT